MLEPLFRIEATLGDATFNASGTREDVQAAYDAWKTLVAEAQAIQRSIADSRAAQLRERSGLDPALLPGLER